VAPDGGILVVGDEFFNPPLLAFARLQAAPTSSHLQSLIDRQTPLTHPGFMTVLGFAIQTQADATTMETALNGLGSQSVPVTIQLQLAPGLSITDFVASLPRKGRGLTLSIVGDGITNTIEGFSPALTVISGDVIVSGVTLITATPSPAVLVLGGSLLLREDSVQQTNAGSASAITLQAGSVDLGTAGNPGGNTINVYGTGPWVSNKTTSPILTIGDTFEIAGVAQTAPHAFADSYTLGENDILSVPPLGVLGNDLDTSGDSLTAVLASEPANGTVVLNPDGTLTYTPTANFAGTDSFTYQAMNADGTFSDPATVTLNVQVVASQLVLTGLPSSTDLGLQQTFLVTAEDSSGRVATNYTGTVHFTSTDPAVPPSDYTFMSAEGGSHTFSPGVSFASAGNRVLTATDTGNGTITGSATVFVNPRPVCWTGAAGDGNWDTAGNWSINAVPGPNDAVTIDLGPDHNTFTVTHSAGTDSVYSLSSQDALVLSGGSLSITTSSTLNGSFTLSGGTLGGPGSLMVKAPSAFASGTLDGVTLTIASNQTAVLTGNLQAVHGAVLENDGTLSEGVDGVILSGDSSAVFNNHGTFAKTAGAAPWAAGNTNRYAQVQLAFNNYGTVNVQQGRLVFGLASSASAPFVSSGMLHVADGALATLQGSATFAAGSQTTGDMVQVLYGTASFAGASDQLPAAVYQANQTFLYSATVSMAGTVDGLGGLWLDGSTLDLSAASVAPAATTLPSLYLDQGTLVGPQAWTVTGSFGRYGTLTGGGSVTAEGGATPASPVVDILRLGGEVIDDGTTLANVTLDNYTLILPTDSTATLAALTAVHGSAINNDGTLSEGVDGVILSGDSSSVFNNHGTFAKTAGAAPWVADNTSRYAQVQLAFNNYGKVDVQQGRLVFGLPSSESDSAPFFSSGTLDVASGALATLQGSATFAAGSQTTGDMVQVLYGTASFAGASDQLPAAVYQANQTFLYSATVSMAGTVDGLGGLWLDGSTLDLSAASVTPAATTLPSLYLDQGTLVGPQAWTVTGSFGRYGTLTGGGSVTAEGGATPASPVVDILRLGGEVIDDGTTLANITLDRYALNIPPGASATLYGLRAVNGAILVNGGTINDATSGTLVVGDGTGILDEGISGLASGRQYGQMDVTGAVALAGSLDVSLMGGFTPLPGATFTMLDNQGPADVSGTFARLPEGATFLADGVLWQVSYRGRADSDDIPNDVVLTVIKAATTTAAVTSSNDPSVFGQPLTFTATVTANAAGAATPTGTVQFVIDGQNYGTPVALSGGTASISDATLAAGSYTVAALYSGDDSFLPSDDTATPLGQVVIKANATITVTPYPHTYDGQFHGLSGTATGVLGEDLSALLNLGASQRNAGHYDVAWSFAGSDNYNAASGTSTIDIALRPLHVSAAADNKVYDGTTAATAHLTDDRVVGDVFTDSSTSAAFGDPSAGTGKTLTVSGISICGVDAANYQLVNTMATATADITRAATATGLIASATTPLLGDSVTFTATVTATPRDFTGSVDFFDSTTQTDLGTVSLTDGTASLSTSTLAVGGHTITARYSGDGNFLASFGGAVLTVIAPASLSGTVFEDFNDDGLVDFSEQGIAGVMVSLTGTDDLGHTVSRSQQTDGNGLYSFDNLRPGNYTLTEAQPAGYLQGQDLVGTAGGSLAAVDQFAVPLSAGVRGVGYNYGERPDPTSPVQKNGSQTAAITFWVNTKGQTLINSLNGGGTNGHGSHQLGDWLAATLPNLYGAGSGNNLAGKDNAFVAGLFQQWKKQSLEADVLATALSVYVTNARLDPLDATTHANLASQDSFLVSGDGVGTATWNVGTSGSAFGVANNTTMTILDLLLATDAQSAGGVLYGSDTTLRALADNVYSAVNKAGGIH
jgi:hypothetical protein